MNGRGRERMRRGRGEEGIPVWEGRQPKKESANNIASLVAVGKTEGIREVHDTTWVWATGFFTRECNTLTGAQQLQPGRVSPSLHVFLFGLITL